MIDSILDVAASPWIDLARWVGLGGAGYLALIRRWARRARSTWTRARADRALAAQLRGCP